jgi:DNA-binding NtrC family response regulator
MKDELMPSPRGPILVVDTRVAALRRIGELLRSAGQDVVEAWSFVDAKRQLAARPPALVISSLRLAAFTGLHVVHLGRLAQPDLNAIIVAPGADTALQAEAEHVGASLLVEPVSIDALLALVARILGTEVLTPADASFRLERREEDRRQLVTSGFAPDRRVCERRSTTPTVLTPESKLDA